ncbi:MAG: ABC transporter ATP-binding protein [Ruminobacter sp.]|uniref:ABC transporter ATP-binding protein n=1 Tax=Ruminobacter sp. TaxID=2774296 RepID=UPI00257ECD32|nr:ABC transporter ATP-binding protein [Ruminobacter sp.]MBQ3776351.1 ABC transporter ATP-binding protein [Ruminobacter sp.]
MNTDKKKGIPRLLEISGEKKWFLIVSAVLAAVSTVIQIVPYIASYKIISIYIESRGTSSPQDTDEVFFWGITAVASVLLSMLFNGGSFILSHFAAFRIIFNLRIRLAEHLAALPLGYFTRVSTGEIHKTIHDNADLIELFISHKIPDMVMTLTGAAAVFIMYLYADWKLGLICILVYALSLFIQFRIYGDEGVKKEIRGYFKALEDINASSMEFARGIQVFKMFSLSAGSFSSLKKSVITYRDFALRFADRGSRDFIIFTILVNFFIFFIYPVVIWINSSSPENSGIVLSALFFTVLSNAILPSLMNIMNISNVVMTINEGVERIDAIFSVEPLPVPENPKEPSGSSVEFDHVSFTYHDEKYGSESITRNSGELSEGHHAQGGVRDISFRVEEGRSLAIIGRSGSGKSSILSLLSRFHDVDSGCIRIGGTDIREMSEKCLMEKVGIVLQKTFMFDGTIRENIMAGKADATDEEILNAARLAQCDDILMKYGLDYHIGNSGDVLSGGEKQRLNIARAILKNSPVLLLDEVSSALDSENELRLNRALNELKKNRTIIMVAHKLNSITDADEIIMVDDGRIVARGTHQSLLGNSSEYRKLWELYENADRWSLNSREDMA